MTEGEPPYRAADERFEELMRRMNKAMRAEFTSPVTTERPSISAQITGLPRSGTTILYQLLARASCVAYVSNVMALFWQVPAVGAAIQSHLAANSTNPTTLSSVAGRAPDPLGAHEFGYFWRAAMGHSSNTTRRDLDPWPWERIQALLDDVTGVFARPVVYKNFLALLYADVMRRHLRRVRFIVTDRPDIDTAASLVCLRRRLGIGAGEWMGLRPADDASVHWETDIEQVAWQIASLRRRQRDAAFDLASDSFTVSYAALCDDPREAVAQIVKFLGADSDNWDPAQVPAYLDPGKGASALSASEVHALKHALALYGANGHE